MKRIATNISFHVVVFICIASLGCIKTSRTDDANSTTAAAPTDELSSEPSVSQTPLANPETSSAQANPTTDDRSVGTEPKAEPETTTQVPPQRPSNATASADSVLDISFDDIKLPIQEDMVFRPFMLTDRVKELDGKRIRISGYMLPDTRTKGIKQFVLLKNTECKFGPGGQADHLLNVLMVEGEDARFRSDPVSIEGRLTVKPFQGPDGNTWSIYDVACDRVTRYQPRR